jgi:L-seryl-tRNA(Ser) seleniumtransferase
MQPAERSRPRRGGATAPNPLRALPSVDRLLSGAGGRALIERFSHRRAVDGARGLLDELRRSRSAPFPGVEAELPPPTVESLRAQLAERLEQEQRRSLRRVLNGTGVVIHTNLGRAPLSPEALAAAAAVGAGYSNLEYDLAAGQRGSRHDLVADQLCRLTGAEAALAVNNNAAAVLLVLSALALDREVLISRGQLVEIGGGFRIPDVLRQSGARLIEVGTTNRTYTADYRQAIGPETALLLRVHSSNFRVVGFVHEAPLPELAALAHEHGLLLVDDLGSGSLLDSSRFGLTREPMVQESVRAGADLVSFSGDKLLGGPQCGLLVGSADQIGRLKRHPLTRALRPDKGTLAALSATLEHYLRDEAVQQVPVWRMLAASPAEIERRAERLAGRLAARGWRAELLEGRSTVGGGSLPGETLPTRLLALRSDRSADCLAAQLRRLEPPIVGRIERDRLVLDLRTVLPEEDELLAETLLGGLDRPAADPVGVAPDSAGLDQRPDPRSGG